METSIRERILQALETLWQPVARHGGAALLRSPGVGLTREQSPALLLFPEAEHVRERSNDRVERQLIIRLVALARETGNERPEIIADRLIVAAHSALFAEPNLGGLALGVQELDCDWEVEDADGTAAAIPARYQITYRTLVADLAQAG